MKLLILAAASLAVVSCASLSLEDLEFHAWKLKFGKSYSSFQEEAYRKNIWLSTRRRVLAHNILADQGISTYRMGMNHFSDMNQEEFRQTVLLRGMIPSNETKTIPHLVAKVSTPQGGTAKLSDSVDWRDKGCVTPVKSQGQCGSCWAFSVTGALESHTCIRYGSLPTLSEQQLVDCTRSYGEQGFSLLWSELGSYMGKLKTEACSNSPLLNYYQEGYCRFNPEGVGATCRGYSDVTPRGDESALQHYVASEGPVSVAVDAQHFQNYQSVR
ncbi:hypothetical protein ACEWY4_004970 [Coilia grayii]|uniref:Uncharacterized protein n=1 Tax=Coilia grayii TaxID=363190 RepID=A0ABD1KH66_9TELE